MKEKPVKCEAVRYSSSEDYKQVCFHNAAFDPHDTKVSKETFFTYVYQK